MLTLPADLDLAVRDSFAVLRRLDAVCLWPDVKALCPQLRAIRLTVPPRAILEEDIAVYPGGALAIRDPLRGVLVCDPAAATTVTGTGAVRLRNAVANGGGTAAILHMRTGIVLQNDLPHRLPPQAVSLLSDARSLPGLASQHGPVLIQWLAGGATLWPLVSAPVDRRSARHYHNRPVCGRSKPIGGRQPDRRPCPQCTDRGHAGQNAAHPLCISVREAGGG
jgi:hypothetical protein